MPPPIVQFVYMKLVSKSVVSEAQAAYAVSLADRIRLAMKACGIGSGAALAKLVGVRRQTAYYWLDGTTKNIESATLIKLSEVLGVRQEWLMAGELPIYSVTRPSDDEQQILGFYRRMATSDKMVFMKMARTLASDSNGSTMKDDPFPNARR